MIGILMTALLSSSSGQIYLPNLPENLNLLRPGGSQIFVQDTNFPGGYTVATGYQPNVPAAYGGLYSTAQYGYYGSQPWGYGSYPGYYGYPGYGYGYGNFYGGYCGYCSPAYTAAGVVARESTGDSQEQREIKKNLDEIKSYLDKDIKGTLDKLTDSLKQVEKRIEASEKTGMSIEARVKWIEEEMKQRLFWRDMESKLDQHLKPLEQRLRELNERLEKHDAAQRLQHDDIMRRQQAPKPPQPKPVEPPQLKPAEPMPVEPKPAGVMTDNALKSIEIKLDRIQGAVLVEISAIQNRLTQFEEMIKEERALRTKIEERLKNIEKTIPPQEDAPKDKQDAGGSPKVRVAQVSLSQEGVPANKALVVVSLPADAKLFLNNQLTRAQGAVRSFMTPELPSADSFTYTLRMEVFQNGALRTQMQEVTFRAGQRVQVAFPSDGEANLAAGRK